jgi:hypothetical protein
MIRRIFLALVTFLVGLALTAPASADTPGRKVFALVVTSNHGSAGQRPDLRYADDDGVKYAEFFSMIGGAANVVLHTELDRDTERLYPAAKAGARPPRRADVLGSAHAMSERVLAATRDGSTVDFYFVFAGHGDVDQGKGYLELADGRLTSDDVDSLLHAIPATHTHVILDSCNSFFVLGSRKPGGRIVATPDDLATSLTKRLPNVGVFLSTSAEAEVYEWSELQAGIFSHAVRSGLAGAADANGDGSVSYDELRAFLAVATDKIKNPQYRPHVFARGPSGRNGEALVRLHDVRAKRVRLEAADDVRLTVRDVEDVPVIDLHKEAGVALTLALPERWAAHATTERLASDGAVERRALGDADDEVLGDGAARVARAEPRGVVVALRTLFSSPFGPRALAELEAQPPETGDDVFGVDREHVERLRLVWAEAAASERDRRLRSGTIALGATAVLTGSATYLLLETDNTGLYPYIMYAYGALTAFTGLKRLLVRSDAELANGNYGLNPPGERNPRLFAVNENNLFVMARSNRAERDWQRWTWGAILGGSAALFALNEVAAATDKSNGWNHDDRLWGYRFAFGGGMVLGGVLFVDSFFPTPIERLAKLWANDPGRARWSTPAQTLSFNVSPIAGGAATTLGFKF